MMFQKNLQIRQAKAQKHPPHLTPGPSPPARLNKLKKQRHNRVNQRRRKDPLRRRILMRINIIGEKRNIQHQTRHRHGGNLRFIRPQKVEEVPKRIRRIKLEEIVDDKA